MAFLPQNWPNLPIFGLFSGQIGLQNLDILGPKTVIFDLILAKIIQNTAQKRLLVVPEALTYICTYYSSLKDR